MIVISIEGTRKTPEGRNHGKETWKSRGTIGRKEEGQMLAFRKNRNERLVGQITRSSSLAKAKGKLTTDLPRGQMSAPVLQLRGDSQGPQNLRKYGSE